MDADTRTTPLTVGRIVPLDGSIRERDAMWERDKPDWPMWMVTDDVHALLQAGDALAEAVAGFFHAKDADLFRPGTPEDAERESVTLDEMLDALARWLEVVDG